MKKARRSAVIAVALAALCMAATSCDDSSPAPVVSATPGPVGGLPGDEWRSGQLSPQEFTALVVQMFWGSQQNTDDRKAMCATIRLIGTDGVADLMRAYAEGKDTGDLEPALAVRLIEERCLAEGY